MFRCELSPDLEERFLNFNNNRGKKKTISRDSGGQWHPPISAPLQLTPVRRWRPAQHEVMQQLRKEGILRNTSSDGPATSKVPNPQDFGERLNKVHKNGSSLEERIRLAKMLREQRLWDNGAMARQSKMRRNRIVDWQNKMQEERKRDIDDRMREAQERKRKIIEDKVSQNRRREYTGWGDLQ